MIGAIAAAALPSVSAPIKPFQDPLRNLAPYLLSFTTDNRYLICGDLKLDGILMIDLRGK